MERGARADRLLWLGVFALALLLRLACVGHGAPHHEYVPDNHIVRAALGMLAERDPFPPPGRYTTYPYLLPYMLTPVYAGSYLWARWHGEVSSAQDYGERACEDPFPLFVMARVLVAFFGALSAAWSYLLARRLGASLARAAAAGFLVAAGVLPLQLSVQARPWVPMAFFVLVACERAVRHLRSGSAAAAVHCALAAGAAAACHPVGFLAFAPLVALARLLRARPALLALCLGAALAVTAMGYPYVLVGGGLETSTTFREAPLHIGGQGLFLRFDGSRFAVMARALLLGAPALWLLVSLALAGLMRPRAASQPAGQGVARWLVAIVAGADLAIFLAYFGSFERYFLPALFLLPGWALASLPAGSRWFRVALGALLLAVLATAVRFIAVSNREDTRAQATSALLAQRRGRCFAIEAHGPKPPLNRRALERLHRMDPGGWTLREEQRLRRGVDSGLDAIPLERIFRDHRLCDWKRAFAIYWSSLARPRPEAQARDPLHSALALTLWAEGVSDVLTARREPGEGSRLLDVLLARRADLVRVFDPGSGDAHLPSELARGWLSLWQVRCPGPRIEWYRLR